jgi:formylglycine-generating enzyme required for sulfatase activity
VSRSTFARNAHWAWAMVLAAMACVADATEMVLVPAGAFTMGRDDGPVDERPAHRVDVPAFRVDRLPVTNRQFAEFLNASGLRGARGERRYDEDDSDARVRLEGGRWVPHPGHADHPVVEASWPGARDFCAWQGKRLPTEAEWEKAARGTDARRYPWGDALPDASRAHFGAGWNDLAPVGTRPRGASPYGVLDMAGNGWDWVSSAYRPYPYRADDGREDLTVNVVRGTRGGGHDSRPEDLTTTQRGRAVSRAPQAGHHNIRFRCARSD